MTFASFIVLYLAGLATFLSPCVLPLLPLYVSILSGSGGSKRTPLALAGLGFTLGLSVVFVAFGLGASSLALALSDYRRGLMIVAGAAMIALGTKLTGLVRLGILERDVRPLLARVPSPGGFVGGVLFGAAFSLGWTPCVGPVLGATLTYAASHAASPRVAATELASYALGLSTPLLAAALAAPRVLALTRRLRGAAAMMQRGMGVVLVGMGLLVATDHVNALVPTTFASAASPFQALPTAASECSAPGADACSVSEHEVRGEPHAGVPLGRAHLVEFVSPHCTVCARLAPVVAELERTCTSGDGTILRMDVETPEGRALAQRFGIHAVPTFLQLDAQGAERQRVVGERSRAELALALASVRGEACALL